MTRSYTSGLAILVSWLSVMGQTSHLQDPESLALALTTGHDRPAAIQEVLRSPTKSLPLLLEWTTKPPSVNHDRLYPVMAELFGRLQAREAVPFLVSKILVNDLPGPGYVWAGTADEVLGRLPAAKALVRIGPFTLPYLRTAYEASKGDEQFAIALVLCLIGDQRVGQVLASIRADSHILSFNSSYGLAELDRMGPSAGVHYPEETAAELLSPDALAGAMADFSNKKAHAAAIQALAASPREGCVTLLRWIRTPPAGVDIYDLTVAMMEAFGEIRAPEGVPFIISHITWLPNAWGNPGNIWNKSPETLAERFPGIGALVRIGSPATSQVASAYYNSAGTDRIAITVALALLKDARARYALSEINRQASLLEGAADQRLARIEKRRSMVKARSTSMK